MKKILLITINYHNARVTQTLINSLKNCQAKDHLKVIILDNYSDANSLSEIEKIQANSALEIEILSSKQNLYYWGGAAHVLKSANLDYSLVPDWIIVCNNDVMFTQKSFFKKLLDYDPLLYPIIAPSILSTSSGIDLNPFLNKPNSRIQNIYYWLYYLHSYSARAVHKVGRLINAGKNLLDQHFDHNEIRPIYAPHGSCIIFSRKYFQSGGYLDSGFTFYGEEISVAEISRKLNLSVKYIPYLQVEHNEHKSTKNVSWLTNYNHSRETYQYLKEKYLI